MNDNGKGPIHIGDGAAIPRKKDFGLFNAWWLAFFGAIGLLFYLCFFKKDPYFEILTYLADGIPVTIKVTVLAICLALVLGLITGLGRISRIPVINLIASFYVEVVRGIPLLVQLFYLYYGMANFVKWHLFFDKIVNFFIGTVLGLDPGPIIESAVIVGLKNFLPEDILSASVAMGICYGAYMGEVFRAGITSIDKGQIEASRSIGFNRKQTMFCVILPQAWRTILPPVGNEFIALLKDSSLVSILAVSDILRRGTEYNSIYYVTFETYTVVALIYLLITLVLSKGVSIMENKLNYYDKRH